LGLFALIRVRSPIRSPDAHGEADLVAVNASIERLETAATPHATSAREILELAKMAGLLYRMQDPAERRRLLETVLSNGTFDRDFVSDLQ
jgi:hypothetical protein